MDRGASPGPTSGSACPARRPARRRPLPRPRRGTRACARFSRKPAAPASMTTSSMRASRSRWSGCGCGWRTTSPASRPRIATAVMRALRHRRRRARCRRRARPRRAIPGSMRARQAEPPFIGSPDWMRLPLTGYPDFATWQPFLDEIITHPAPGSRSARGTISAAPSTFPGFTSRPGSTSFRPA